MVRPAHQATYQDVVDAPAHMVAELIDGQLFLQPRPARGHAKVASVLGALILPPYQLGVGGPGGWEIVDEPEIHLGRNVLVPDLAGWRIDVSDPYDGLQTYFMAVPQWVCEVLSKSTARKDRAYKLPLYARAGVEHAWLIDPATQRVEIYTRQGGDLRCTQSHEGCGVLAAQPFEANPIRTEVLWPA